MKISIFIYKFLETCLCIWVPDEHKIATNFSICLNATMDIKPHIIKKKSTVDKKAPLPKSDVKPVDKKAQHPKSDVKPVDKKAQPPKSDIKPVDKKAQPPKSDIKPVDKKAQPPKSDIKLVVKKAQPPKSDVKPVVKKTPPSKSDVKPVDTQRLDVMTVVELRAEAKSKGIVGISKMKRAELLEAIMTIPKTRTSPIVYTMVLDTETTGLPEKIPKEIYPQYTDTEKYDCARIVQWTWGLYDDTGLPIEMHDYIIKPENFEIPQESVKFHKITTEHANKNGVSFAIVAKNFLESLEQVHVIVGHNIMFDLNVIKSELYRRLMAVPLTSESLDTNTHLMAQPEKTDEYKLLIRILDSKGIICTMTNSKNVCALTRQSSGYKFPSLKELYTYITNESPDVDKLHNALYDVECTAMCYFGLLGRIV